MSDQQYVTRSAVVTGTSAVATLPGAMYPRQLHGLTITGPVGSRANVYLGAIQPASRIDQTARGQSNSADYSTPRSVPPGTPILVEWPNSAANAVLCTATFVVSQVG